MNKYRNIVFFSTLSIILVFMLIFSSIIRSENKKHIRLARKMTAAEKLIEKGRFDRARTRLLEIAKAYPRDYKTYWKIGICLAAKNKYKKADHYFTKARKVNPLIVMEPLYLIQYADIRISLGDYESAINCLKQSKKRAGRNSELRKMADHFLYKADRQMN